ncbi:MULTISPECIES: response regulator [unclassified Burkholderia]|uniref:response regulator n=1 Tax=unclassified Burkholderia TaxID=2613784 RepID=UPI001423FD5F|nr:response regulator transcription factor [Burkholderia sp. Tr-860]NIF63789.1 response regulator transcription factor [Burkholderia sp. Cy-647]NIF71045.1 response regulator transcription factor [Burkholderia sp. Ap-962]NIF98413.1 response regulator transcription factor [Burkholderia sp. Ax-1720]
MSSAYSQAHAPLVAIVDDDRAVRDGVALLLHSVGVPSQRFCDAYALFDTIAAGSAIGCVLLDIRMPGMSGLDALERLGEHADLPVIVFTGHGSIDACRQAFKRGAIDFLRKPVDDDELIAAVQHALRRHQTLRKQDQTRQQRLAELSTLSGREREVLDSIVQGASNKETARLLGLSPRTVETYRATLFDKLRAGSLVELVRDYAPLLRHSTA